VKQKLDGNEKTKNKTKTTKDKKNKKQKTKNKNKKQKLDAEDAEETQSRRGQQERMLNPKSSAPLFLPLRPLRQAVSEVLSAL